jgi:hypothetical protein
VDRSSLENRCCGTQTNGLQRLLDVLVAQGATGLTAARSGRHSTSRPTAGGSLTGAATR